MLRQLTAAETLTYAQLSTGQKSQDAEESGALVDEIEQDETDSIEAMAEQRLERSLERFSHGAACAP